MSAFQAQQREWSRYRKRLEQEIRILVVDGDRSVSKQLDDLLYRRRIPARSVASAEQALTLIAREHYSVVIVAETLPGMRGLALTRQVRVSRAEVDVILLSWEPSVPVLAQCFDLRLLDVLTKPFSDIELVGDRLADAVRRNVDRRMRTHILGELRASLRALNPDARLRTTAALDRRLSAYKHALGAFDRVLVVESQQSDLRTLSENLLLGGLYVETADTLDDAVARVAGRDIFLLLLDVDLDSEGIATLLHRLNAADPHLALAVVAHQPTVETAMAAMREGVDGYFLWPPASMPHVVLRVRDILRRGRRDRLIDNLFVELYRETNRTLGPNLSAEDDAFTAFRRLIGLERILAADDAGSDNAADNAGDSSDAVEYLDEVLSEMLVDLEDQQEMPVAETEAAAASERRVHMRVPESEFVRFKLNDASAATLAYLGDLSEGGIFIRSAELLKPGTIVEVDFNAVHKEQAYLIRCRAQVAWVARDDRTSPLGPGFGVKFLGPPADVVDLLRRIVKTHDNQS